MRWLAPAMRQRASLTIIALGVALLVVAVSSAGAQPTTSARGQLVLLDARITGEGPWTSWLGGPAQRELLVTIENRSELTITPTLTLRQGKGDPTTARPGPSFEPLEPDERVTVTVDVELPAFSFGTHAVVGEFTGGDDPPRFRAETTHVPWLLLVLPALLLIQVGLVAIRNRARRVITEPFDPPATVEPDRWVEPVTVEAVDAEPARPEHRSEWVIRHELDSALAGLVYASVDDPAFVAALQQQAAETTDRIARRLQVGPDDRPALAAKVTEALLSKIDANRLVDH